MQELLHHLNLSTFIAFDLETTGLNVEEDEIIEFAAVKYVNGKKADEIDLLIKPSKEIPPEIEQLTGITNQMVGRAPGIRKQLPVILDFIEDHPLVAHNIPFDYSFLTGKMMENKKGGALDNPLYDTLTLSRIFFFYMPEFRLGPLMEQIGISREGSHRANVDAENVAVLFLKLIERMQEYDLETYQVMNRILRETKEPNKKLFIDFANYYIRQKKMGQNRKYLKSIWKSPPNIYGKPIAEIDDKARKISVSEDISGIFGENSRLAHSLPYYEIRAEQINMAESIQDVLRDESIVIIEAGTGVGKSLGYLIPAIYHLYEATDNERVVVSSNTKNLQEQLFYKEIPFIREKIGWEFKAVLLKGRNNYICLTRWKRLIANLENMLKPWERVKILPIVVWLQHTTTGDVNECRGFNQEYSPKIWSRMCSEPGYCTTQVCRKNHFCYLGKVRSEAHSADVVVINHSLLMANATSDKRALPDFQYLVVDEGHNLEKNAYQYFAREYNYWNVYQTCSQLYYPAKTPSGRLYDLQNHFKGDKNARTILKSLERSIQKVEEALNLNETIFNEICTTIEGSGKEFAYVFKKRFKSSDNPLKNYEQLLFMFLDLMADLSENLKILIEQLIEYGQQDMFKEKEEITGDLKNSRESVEKIVLNLQELLESRREDFIYWYEISKEKEKNVYFYFTPLHVGELLYNSIFSDLKSVIITSATLKIADSFEYMTNRLGLDYFDKDRLRYLDFGSPFDYDRQVCFVTLDHSLSPNVDRYFDLVSELIAGIAREYKRGTLVLFTSYKSLMDTFKKSEKRYRGDVKFLRQTRAISRHDLLDIFKKERSSILFGTDSFWEGVDVIGDSLEILIITKLPFSVPSEPVVEANIEEFRRQGKNPFTEYQVPEAILKFRQGFGRLIRSKNDKGVIICLDSRIEKKEYGKYFRKSLPAKLTIHKDTEDLLRNIGRFFRDWDN